jgi:trehalose-phosphatase
MSQTVFQGRISVEVPAAVSSAEFFNRLAHAKESLLLLDYDGTLAPFQPDRDRAYPYPGVVPLLEEILRQGRSRVVIVTGRPVADIRALLPQLKIEIYGSHGLECLSPDDSYRRAAIAPEIAASLSSAESCFVAAGLGDQMETKPGGIAIHWRGVSAEAAKEIQLRALQGMAHFAKPPELLQLEFDGGVELRVARPNKGDAVRSILHDSSANIPIAFLGDDITDEDAFQVVNPLGLSVLVRPEYRDTHACLWLRPPHELLAFLQRWLDCLPA